MRKRARHAIEIATKCEPHLEKFLLAFIPLFVAIDPIGLVAIYLGLGGHAERKRRQHEGTLALITSLAVSIGFIFLGKVIFRALGITVSDFQVAGGLILLGIAVRELLDLGERNRYAGESFGVVPLGMPLIAGPALLTALLLLVDTVGILFTVLALLMNLLLVRLRLPLRRSFYALDGAAGFEGRFETDFALAGRDRREPDPAGLADAVAAERIGV